MRVLLQSAFILHHRPYRETSLLIEAFTYDYGRVSLVAKGVRAIRSKLRALLQPFFPLLLSWDGKTDLMTLTACEANGAALFLKKECLFGGLYLNELLVRLLPKYDAYPQLYTIYYKTLLQLQDNKLQQYVLRVFEKAMLEEMGYGLQLQRDREGNVFQADSYYRYYVDQGFERCANDEYSLSNVFSGKNLQAIARGEFVDEDILRDAKKIMRQAFLTLLGGTRLQSRKLFLYQGDRNNE